MFFPLFFLSWTLQAVFCGFALAFAANGERKAAQRLVPAITALVSLTCFALFLLNQQFFSGLVLNLSVSAAELTLLFASLCLNWQARGTLNALFRLINLGTFLTSLLWFIGSPSNFFLAVLFFPNAQILEYHAGGAAVFGVIFLSTALAVGITLARSKAPVAPAAPNHPRRFSYFVLGLLGCGLLAAIYFSNALQTMIILKKREHTMQLYQTLPGLVMEIRMADSERMEENESSIYPADLGIKTVRVYIDFLRSNGYIEKSLLFDPNEIEIGNISRNDPDQTIFILTNQVQYDIHTMIDNIGGVPDYAHGFILIRKDGKGEFYRDEKKGSPELGIDPPRVPPYLSVE
jgi:hypothetical protein